MKSAVADDDDDENENHDDHVGDDLMMTTMISLSMKMTTTQVVTTSAPVNNRPTQNYAHTENHAPGHLLIILYPSNIKSDNRPYYRF